MVCFVLVAVAVVAVETTMSHFLQQRWNSVDDSVQSYGWGDFLSVMETMVV